MAYRQNDSQSRNDRVRFDLMEHIGVLSMKDNGWTREVNIVSWNGGAAKVDIREWDPDHKRMTKGVTLFEDEAETLTKVLARRYGLRLTDREPSGRTFFREESDVTSFTEEPSAKTKSLFSAEGPETENADEPAESAADIAAMMSETGGPLQDEAASRVAENVS